MYFCVQIAIVLSRVKRVLLSGLSLLRLNLSEHTQLYFLLSLGL
jgi:hypothetical protein